MSLLVFLTGAQMTHLHPQRPSPAWGAAHTGPLQRGGKFTQTHSSVGESSHRPTPAWGEAHTDPLQHEGQQTQLYLCNSLLSHRKASSPLAIVCSVYDLGQDLVDFVTFLDSFLGLRSLLPSRREFLFIGNSHTAACNLGDRVESWLPNY